VHLSALGQDHPHNGLVLNFLNITFDEEFLKLPCVFFNTRFSLLKITEFGVVILKVRRGEELAF